jgi:hypothetical protein
MKTPALLALLALLLAPTAHAADNPRCIEAYKAEIARIGRDAEAAAKINPPPQDREGQRQYMIPIEKALNAAAEKARQCEEGSRGAPKGPAK